MPLTLEDLPKLEPLLRQAVVRIKSGGKRGSGFVVSPQRVLTCFHVVAGHDEQSPISVSDWQGHEFTGTVIEERGPGWPDLALLRVDGLDAPCPLLTIDSVIRESPVIVAGYLGESEVPYQAKTMRSGGDGQFNNQGEPYLRVLGDVIVGGISGGPVLDVATGSIAGVMRLTVDEQVPTGGFAVPMAAVIQHLPTLGEPFDRPPPAAGAWLEAVGARVLLEIKRRPDGMRFEAETEALRRVDLEVSMNDQPPGGWRVSAITTLNNQVNVGDLGDDVMQALQRWSQRRTFGRNEEDRLLGKVLYRALLPTPVEAVLAEETNQSTQVLVRVRVSADNELAAIPWEYARKSEQEIPVSTRIQAPFSRFVDSPSKPIQQADRLRVYGMVQSPTKIFRPIFFGSEGGIKPQPATDLRKHLARILAGKTKIDQRVDMDQDLGDLKANPTGERWHVVHYLGHAWDDGKLYSNIGSSGYQLVDLNLFLEAISSMQPTVVVLQLLPSPSERSWPELGLVTSLRLLAGSVQAVVVAQHAASDKHIAGFNERFYSALAGGESVEQAVTRGREELLSQPPYEDTTAFGTVSVTTCFKGDVKLVTSDSSRSQLAPDAEVPTHATPRVQSHG